MECSNAYDNKAFKTDGGKGALFFKKSNSKQKYPTLIYMLYIHINF